MNTGGIGILIGELRKEAGIQQGRLCKGVCSAQLLSKIEHEESEADMLLLQVLFQRLGKSMEKFDIIINVDEYEHIRKRDEIEDNIRFGKLDEGEESLKEYLKRYKKKGNIQAIYGYRMKGVIAIERKEYEAAEEWLEKAVLFSVSDKDLINFDGELLSVFEIENFVLLAQAWINLKKKDEAKDLLEKLYRYSKEHITDETELVKVQSKIAALLGELYNEEGRYEQCLNICESVFELERRNFMLQAMTLILDNMICAYSGIGESSKAEEALLWKDTVVGVFELQNLSVDIVNGMYFDACTTQYYLDCEVIRAERIRKGLTQEKLAEGIYENPESLSRVETGKEKPNRIKFAQLLEKLGVDKTRYNSYLVTKEYKVLEVDSKIEKLISIDEYEKAEKELEYLERVVDLNIPQNQQLIKRRKNMFLYKRNKSTELCEGVKIEEEQTLALTYGVEVNASSRVPFREELLTYNQICIMQKKLYGVEQSIKSMKRMIDCFFNSRVEVKYHFRSIILLISNMSSQMDGNMESYWNQSIYWSEKGIRLALCNGKGTTVHILVSNIANIYKKQNKERELCIKLAMQTLRWSQLFRDNKYVEITKRYLVDNLQFM